MKILEAIGKTPLLYLGRLSEQAGAHIYVKMEMRNPGGSIKDRVAMALILGAMNRGQVAPGHTVVEATSGNMGIGLALVCGQLGMPLVLTMPASVSEERKTLLRSMGVELILTPAAEGMSGAVAKAIDLEAQIPGAFRVDQFANPDGPRIHFETTGPEIVKAAAMEGFRVDAFTTGIGSGGTISGVGQRLRTINPAVHIAGIEPAESPVLSGGKASPHGIQGIGAGFVPVVLDRSVLNEMLVVTAPEAMAMARNLLKLEGLSCGISSGANVCGAVQLASRPEFKGKHIVTIACDGGERYMSTALFQ